MDFECVQLKNSCLENDYALDCQPYEYLFFCIPEEQYGRLKEIRMEIQVASKQAVIVLNEYRGNEPMRLEGNRIVTWEADQCEAGENMLAYKGQIHIRGIKILTEGEEAATLEERPEKEPLKAAAAFLLGSQIPSRGRRSRFDGSCFAMYDYTNGCHRMPCWLWSDAPVVSAAIELIHLGRHSELHESLDHLVRSIGEVFLDTQILDEQEEAYGALVSRYRFYGKKDRSFHCLLGMNDTSYSVKWALLPLYEYTGDERYLQAAVRALEWVEKNIQNMDFVPSHYYFENKVWEPKAFVDTGFCADGFEKYQQVTGDTKYKGTMEFVMNRFLKQFALGNGYFGQNYTPGAGVDKRLFTRGHAWVLEGLLACMRGIGKTEYQKQAKDLIQKLIPCQAEDGSFSYLLGYGEPADVELKYSGICEKATAILAYLFLEYNRMIPDKEVELSAKKALKWCENHMAQGAGLGYGGIHASSLASGIVGLPYLDVATGYANAYYIMASLLKEKE